jgi:hypothetical protein
MSAWLVSSTNDHERPCNLKPQQRDLTPVLRRPVEPAHQQRTSLGCSIPRNIQQPANVPLTKLELALIQPPAEQLVPEPKPVRVDHIRLPSRAPYLERVPSHGGG